VKMTIKLIKTVLWDGFVKQESFKSVKTTIKLIKT